MTQREEMIKIVRVIFNSSLNVGQIGFDHVYMGTPSEYAMRFCKEGMMM